MTGIIHVYTGTGGGKTTSALGAGLRSFGWNKKVIAILFMKGRDIGEVKAAKKLGKNFIIKQFGSKKMINLKNPSDKDRMIAEEGLKYAYECLKKDPDVLILDEINLAARINLVNKQDVLDLLQRTKKKTTVYLTGRYAPKEFLKVADFITNIKTTKQPKRLLYRKGIEY